MELDSGIRLGLVLQLEVQPGADAKFRYTFRAGSPDRGSTWS